MNTPFVARVVVDVPARTLSEPFDYAVPERIAERVAVGVPVVVPFGHRRALGYVVGLGASSAYDGSLRGIDAVVGVPVFDDGALALAQWIADEYVAPLSEALRLFLPPGGAPRVRKGADGEWSVEGRQIAPVHDVLVTLTGMDAAYRPPARATVQHAVVEALAAGPRTLAELCALAPGARSAVRALQARGVVRLEERRRYRRPDGRARGGAPHMLTPEQEAAVSEVERAVTEGGGVVVLEGVTGSGKTEVYLAAIERVLAGGKTAIVLVPEIALTPQTVSRFRARLGDKVAVIHSRLSTGERFDQWQLARDGVVRVVVGARSALFAPLPDLGLVIIDEEHEPTYKQSQAPRYHARNVAERLCAHRGAALLLGSATPSMETRERVRTGDYRHVRLTRRLGGGAPSHVSVVDMAAEFAQGHRSMYSRALQSALAEVVTRGTKAVLFLNRRGFASFLLCRECGFVPHCESCSVSLTYHEATARLQCHHCGARRDVPPLCPRCGSAYLRRFGAGTQRAEAELAALLPGVPIIRMDADTTAGKSGHERALAAFEAEPCAVLLGTQMIAKGLDYPEVTLVGVLNADTSMHLPDFRAAERTFQLLEQVAGRAGRGPLGGRVIIQTYWPDHPAVVAVASGDPSALYEGERSQRAALGYPPFGRLVNVGVSGTSSGAVSAAADHVAAALRVLCPPEWEVLGPAPAPIARVKGRWRWHVLVKAPVGAAVSAPVRAALGAVGTPDDVTVVADVDPVSML
jgi:primosomal protein N' (replication factor Y)